MSNNRFCKNNSDVMDIIPLNRETNKFWKYNKRVSERKRKFYNNFFIRKDRELKTVGVEE